MRPDPRRPSLWMFGTAAALAGTACCFRQLQRAVRARSIAERRLATLAATSIDPVVLVDEEGEIRWASPSAGTLFGAVSPGASLLPLVVPADRSRFAAALRAGSDVPVRIPVRMCRPGGVPTDLQATIDDRRRAPGVRGLVVVLRPDLSSADALRWRHEALHDRLTNLANRGGLYESLNQPEPSGELTLSSAHHYAVLYADLDGFKAINDTHGHAAGDRLLQEIAERLQRQVRPGDTVARLGGDEFVVVIDDLDDEVRATEIAERIRASLTEPVDLGTATVSVTASFGIAVGPDHQASALLDRADVALYRAKRSGRDRCVLWTDAMAPSTPHKG